MSSVCDLGESSCSYGFFESLKGRHIKVGEGMYLRRWSSGTYLPTYLRLVYEIYKLTFTKQL